MNESAIALGGWPAFWTALLIGLAAMTWFPKRDPLLKYRWLILWMLWCGLTPVYPWHIDIPMMLGYMWVMETLWRVMMRRWARKETR